MKLILSVLVVLATLAGTPARAADTAIFDGLGGKPGIIRIVDTLIQLMLTDPRIAARFDGIDMPHLALRLKEQICVVSGGPCTYRGKTMKLIHDGLDINDAMFNAMVEDLQEAMDRSGVAYATQNKLLARLAPMHKDVVTK